MDRALDRHLDRTYRFLWKVKGSRRYALNVISGTSHGHSVTMFEYHYQRYFRCKSYEFDKYIEHNDFCNTQMMEYLLEKTSVPIEVEGTALEIYFPEALGLGDIEPQLDHLFNIRKRMPKYLFAG